MQKRTWKRDNENEKYQEIIINGESDITASDDANLKMAEHLYCKIFCNQIEPTYFGRTSEQLLWFLPISGENVGNSTFHEYYSKHSFNIIN